MKIKLLLTGVVAAAIVASSAVGSPSADKGKPNATGPGCKPRIAVILKGTLTGAGNPLTVKVAKANHWGKAYVGGEYRYSNYEHGLARNQVALTLGTRF